jgi:metal-sulfur cluster biosynthetic enzyme
LNATRTVATRAAILSALEAVRDPELDEPITSLGFVTSCAVSEGGAALVRLRLPTYFCAPNFAFLMVADAYDVVSAVDGVSSTQVVLEDHFAGDAINAGVAARTGFAATFADEARGELDELRAEFLRKAVLAGTDQVCRPLVQAGTDLEQLVVMTLGDAPPSRALSRLRQRPAAAVRGRRASRVRHGRGGVRMKALRLHPFHQAPVVDEAAGPSSSPDCPPTSASDRGGQGRAE